MSPALQLFSLGIIGLLLATNMFLVLTRGHIAFNVRMKHVRSLTNILICSRKAGVTVTDVRNCVNNELEKA